MHKFLEELPTFCNVEYDFPPMLSRHKLTRKPSTEPMLMTDEGLSRVALAVKRGKQLE